MGPSEDEQCSMRSCPHSPAPLAHCAGACLAGTHLQGHAHALTRLPPWHTVQVPALLAPTFKAMVRFVAHPSLPAQNVNVKIINVMEGFLEVCARPLACTAWLCAVAARWRTVCALGWWVGRV